MNTLISKTRMLALMLITLLIGASTVFAGVNVQCPTLTDPLDPTSVDFGGGDFQDLNNDGVIRADDGEIVNPVSPTQVCFHLAAGDGFVSMADGREQYMFGFANATGVNDDSVMNQFMEGAVFPSPTITVKQGDDVYLSLTNVGMNQRPDLFDPHTVHWHGFPNASAIFDGVPDASVSVNMASTLTYYYHVNDPGTFMYHCHVEATEHMQMGMLGNLYVTPAQDETLVGNTVDGGSYVMQAGDRFAYNDLDGSTVYDVDYPIQIASFDPEFHDASLAVQPLPFADMDDKYPMINGRGYPDTVDPATALAHPHGASSPVSSRLEAVSGDRILLRVSSLSTTSFHTLTLLGLDMQVVGKGSRKLDEYYMTSSITMGGGESYDVIVDTTGTTTGDRYYLYATQLDHLTNNDDDYGGMMTEIVIIP
jgi:FtsP/CotA-like multicopper oxidase with cupredoxin domain